MQVWLERSKDVWDLVPEVGRNAETGVVTVTVDRKNKEVPEAQTVHVDPTHLLDLDDLCEMNNLHEGPLLDMLRKRVHADKIYTNTGNVLISINPYQTITGLYADPLRYYLPLERGEEIAQLPPHLFKTSNGAYRHLTMEKHNQSIIISGESGAGKTEGSKYVMNFLIAVNDKVTTQSRGHGGVTEGTGEHIKRVLLDSNVVFESFGNAKTVRNDNSSRFGKYIRLQYTRQDVLVSAFTETFLLERSRLTSPPVEGERRYHVFYGLFCGRHECLDLVALKLDGGLAAFPMLCQPSGKDPTVADDVQNFSDLCSSLRTLGASDGEMREIFSHLAIILHLSNVTVTEGAAEGASVEVSFSTQSIGALVEALGLPQDDFVRALTVHVIHLAHSNTTTEKILSTDDVMNNVNALMKWLYSALFRWLVAKINYAHCTLPGGDNEKQQRVAVKFIGILDIFGFEILKHNSFEQLCINYTNERLQQQFNEQIFVTEQAEYVDEGLDWSSIHFRSNQAVIDLISKKPTGLLNVLEEHGFMNRRPDDIALLHNYDQFHKGKHDCYSKSRYGDESFIVQHFAGSVEYEIAGFIEKNNDTLQEDLLRLLRHSTNTFLLNMTGIIVETSSTYFDQKHQEVAPGFVPAIPEHLIVRVTDGNAALEEAPIVNIKASSLRHRSSIVAAMPSDPALGTKMAASVTVSFQFRHQLEELMSTLRATHPHYIKCIKPNGAKKPHHIVSPIVLEQLRYSGILEVVRIRREGYPIRIPVIDFYKTFEMLSFGKGWKRPFECSETEARQCCVDMMRAVFGDDPDTYQIGHWKVFLKESALNKLYSEIANRQQKQAIAIQSKFRSWFQAKKYRSGLRAVLVIQAAGRARADRRAFVAKMRAVAMLQRVLARARLRKQFYDKCHAATIIRRNMAVLAAMRLQRARGARERKFIRYQREREAERVRRELAEQQAKERVAKEEAARLQRERLEQERRAQEEAARLERERLEQERLEQERLRMQREKEQAAALVLQCVWRGSRARGNYHHLLRVKNVKENMGDIVVVLQAHIRGKLGKRQARLLRLAIERLRRHIRLNIRNLRLFVRIMRLHRWCRTGDVEAVANHLATDYSDLQIRNKWHNYQTCLHSAVQGGQLDILDILRPDHEEVLKRDINGYTAIHHAAMFPDLQIVKYLERVLLLKNTPILAGSVSFSDDWGIDDCDVDDGASVSETASVVAYLENTDFGEKIKEGWLKKVTRGFLGGLFGPGAGKRWVVLYETHLLYYKSPNDAKPRGAVPITNAQVKRGTDRSRHGFDMFSDNISSQKKKTKRYLQFLAESEIELQEWLVQLKSLVGVESAFRSDPPVHYINSNLRDVWLSEQNNFGETPLHVAARYRPKNQPALDVANTVVSTCRSRNVSVVKDPPQPAADQRDLTLVQITHFCIWLIEAGCPLDTQSHRGHTALHLASMYQNAVLAACLVRKGGSRLLLDKSGVLAESYADDTTSAAMRAAAESSALLTSANLNSTLQLLPRPAQLRGFSYLHVLFEKHDSEGAIPTSDRVYMLVSVVNSKSELVEDTQCVPSPMIVHKDHEYWGRNYLWWGYSWHMQTPLENIEQNCVIRAELHKYDANDKLGPSSAAATKKGGRRSSVVVSREGDSLIARAVFPLDLACIDSGLVTIPFLPKGDKVSSTEARIAEHSCLQADMVISKRSKTVTLDQYRKIHTRVHQPRPAVFTSVFSSRTILDMTSVNRSGSIGPSEVDDFNSSSSNIA